MTAIPAEPQIVDEPENPLVRAPLVEGGRTFAEVTNLVAAPAEGALLGLAMYGLVVLWEMYAMRNRSRAEAA